MSPVFEGVPTGRAHRGTGRFPRPDRRAEMADRCRHPTPNQPNTGQAEILLRALCYSTGKILTTRTTPAVICAWLFVYPFVSGESNYTITGLGFGMKARKVMPEGLVLIAIPYDLLPMTIANLKDMDWVLPAYSLTEEETGAYFKKAAGKIMQEYLNG